MKKAFLALLLLAAPRAWAQGTFTAASCSQTDVNAVINGPTHVAVDGDIILVPGNTCSTPGTAASWTSGTLTITKGITLDGQGTANVIVGINGTSGPSAISVIAGTTASAFITGFTFIGGRSAGSCPINFQTTSTPVTKAYRMHHNTIINGSGTLFCHNGVGGPGLIDHNNITWAGGASEILHNLGNPTTTPANYGWMDDVIPGSANMLFIEDNTFTNNDPKFVNGPTTNYYGMRVVFRHNTVIMGTVDGHAGNLGAGGLSGTRWMEIYQNTFQYSAAQTGCWSHAVDVRGGSGVVWGNIMASGGPACGNRPVLSTGPYNGSSDPDSGTWPLPWQVGRGYQTGTATTTETYSPLYAWSNTGFGTGSVLVAQGNANGNFVVAGTGPAACGTFHPGGVCDAINTSGPTGLLRCESAADVATGCPVTYNYTPYTYPHPLTGGVILGFSPSPVSFGNQLVSTTSAFQTVTVSNTGISSETLANPYYTITGLNPTNFANPGGGTCVNGGIILAGGSCTVRVTFTPSATGARTANLNILGTVNGSVSLTGMGTSAPPANTVTLTPSPLAFAPQVQFTTSAAQNAVLAVTSGTEVFNTPYFTITGTNATDFAVTGGATCTNGGTVNSPASCVIPITFTPSTLTSETATLNISGTVTASIQLTGSGSPVPVSNPAPAPTIMVLTPGQRVKSYPCVMPCTISFICPTCTATQRVFMDLSVR